MYRAVIFDLDGTLVDTGIPIANAINYVRESFGLPFLDREVILRSVNDPDTHPPSFFYGVDEYTSRHIELFESYYHRHCIVDIELYAGLEELLVELNNSCELGVATNAATVFAKKILDNRGVERLFSSVVGADLVERAKPDKEMLVKSSSELGVDVSEALFVGDSKKDLLAAKSAGMDYVMVNWGFSSYGDAIESPLELRSKIFEMGSKNSL